MLKTAKTKGMWFQPKLGLNGGSDICGLRYFSNATPANTEENLYCAILCSFLILSVAWPTKIITNRSTRFSQSTNMNTMFSMMIALNTLKSQSKGILGLEAILMGGI